VKNTNGSCKQEYGFSERHGRYHSWVLFFKNARILIYIFIHHMIY